MLSAAEGVATTPGSIIILKLIRGATGGATDTLPGKVLPSSKATLMLFPETLFTVPNLVPLESSNTSPIRMGEPSLTD